MKKIEFKVGQKVVALNSQSKTHHQPRTKGSIYTVANLSYCGGCGKQRINFGGFTECDEIRCTDGCGFIQPTLLMQWSSSEYFAPLDNLHESISEAEKNEDYELAQLLTEVLTENVELSELGI